jgi:hypothetical protein
MIPPKPPTVPPGNVVLPVSPSLGAAPTPPPLAPQYQPQSQGRRRPGRTAAGVVIAVLVLGAKLAVAFGAGHFLAGGSGTVVIITLAVLIVFGFVTRFMRL